MADANYQAGGLVNNFNMLPTCVNVFTSLIYLRGQLGGAGGDSCVEK